MPLFKWCIMCQMLNCASMCVYCVSVVIAMSRQCERQARLPILLTCGQLNREKYVFLSPFSPRKWSRHGCSTFRTLVVTLKPFTIRKMRSLYNWLSIQFFVGSTVVFFRHFDSFKSTTGSNHQMDVRVCNEL